MIVAFRISSMTVLRSEISSGICAKLRTVATRNNRVQFTCHDHSIIACSRHIYVWCCSTRTSHSWWITQSTQHHRRGCNSSKILLIALDEIPDVCSACFKSEFPKRGPRPSWGPRNCSLGPRAEAEQGPRADAKTRYFYWWAGTTSVESILKGGTAHDSLRTTVMSDTDKSC